MTYQSLDLPLTTPSSVRVGKVGIHVVSEQCTTRHYSFIFIGVTSLTRLCSGLDF